MIFSSIVSVQLAAVSALEANPIVQPGWVWLFAGFGAGLVCGLLMQAWITWGQRD